MLNQDGLFSEEEQDNNARQMVEGHSNTSPHQAVTSSNNPSNPLESVSLINNNNNDKNDITNSQLDQYSNLLGQSVEDANDVEIISGISPVIKSQVLGVAPSNVNVVQTSRETQGQSVQQRHDPFQEL